MNMMTKIALLALILASDLFALENNNSKQAIAADGNKTVSKKQTWWEKNVEFDFEIDAYYSNVSWTFSLSDDEVENAVDKSELNVYYDLLMHSFPPRFVIVELSINPFPVLGVYLKEYQRNFYNNSVIFTDVNLVDSITAGFEEPYAASFFLGNTVKFTQSGEDIAMGNRAYAGFLISFADNHIKDNVLIADNSAEIEWKVIGMRHIEKQKLSWSYRIGTRLHEHPEITDTFYLGFMRSRLDFESDILSFLNNAKFEYKSTFSLKNLTSIGHTVYYEKKFPMNWWGKKFGVSLGLGYIYQGDQKYSGYLRQEGIDTHKVIIRPKLEL